MYINYINNNDGGGGSSSSSSSSSSSRNIIIIIITTTTQYSKFQFKICFNKVIRFLVTSTSLNTTLAAKHILQLESF
jgi:hypothetical protein